MAFEHLNVFTPRRIAFNYMAPAVCEAMFSGSGEVTISLQPISENTVAGLLWTWLGTFGRLSWGAYPGALCYSIYKLVDEEDPFSEYVIVAECVTDLFLSNLAPGTFNVTAITPNGETSFGNPIEGSDPTPPVCGGEDCNPSTIEIVYPSMWTLNGEYTLATSWVPAPECLPVLTEPDDAIWHGVALLEGEGIAAALGHMNNQGAGYVFSYPNGLQYYYEVSWNAFNPTLERVLWAGVRSYCANLNGAYQQLTLTSDVFGQHYQGVFAGFCSWPDPGYTEIHSGISSYTQGAGPVCIRLTGAPVL